MINKDGGGGGGEAEDNFWILWGDTAVMRGTYSSLGKTLPGMTVFGRSAVVSPAFKKQFYKELQTPFLMENNNKNNRNKTIEN